jgi:hypothetical protein
MKVVVRSSSLLFFFVNLLLGLPVRRALGSGLDQRRPIREKPLPIGSTSSPGVAPDHGEY